MLLFNYDFLRVAANPARETIAAADAITVTSKVCGAVVSVTVSSAGSSAAGAASVSATVSAAVSGSVSATVSASVSATVSASVSATVSASVSASVSAVSPAPLRVITPQTSALFAAESSSSDQPRQYGRVRKSSASLYWKSPRNVKPSTSSSGSMSAGTNLNSRMQWVSSGKLHAT